ncbi:MAG: hypothetical protein ACN6OQ_01530, partial [Paraburkholderia nemoris]
MRNPHEVQTCEGGPVSPRRRALLAASVCAALVYGCSAPGAGDAGALAQGVVWQLDDDHVDPRGDWNRLGVTDLLVQWTAVDGMSFLPGTAMQTARRLPDWTRIAGEPWAR